MKPRKSRCRRARPGITLIESALVLLVLLSLVSILFVSTRRWKQGSDRTLCVLSLHQVQQAVRGHANLHGKSEGDKIPGLAVLIFGEGKYIEKTPLCPSGGLYDFGGDRVPMRGELYMNCSLAADDGHLPENATGW
jgi:type II secretory pathway pseudopilin PulG